MGRKIFDFDMGAHCSLDSAELKVSWFIGFGWTIEDDEHKVAAAGTWRQMVPAAGSKNGGKKTWVCLPTYEPASAACCPPVSAAMMSENIGDATRYYSTHKAATRSRSTLNLSRRK